MIEPGPRSARCATLHRRIRAAVLAALPFLLCGCGPTEEEAGTAVLCAAPVVMLLGSVLLSVLRRLWSRRYPEVSFRLLPTLLVAGALTNGALVKTLIAQGPTGYLYDAFVLFGTSYGALLLLFWRIWFAFDVRRAFTWVGPPLMALYAAPSIYFAFEGSSARGAPDWLLDAWMWPGIVGWVPGGLFLVLLVEAGVRGRVPRREPLPNPLVEGTSPG